MALPLYLAQTAAEMAGNPLPEKSAYMACHFSSGGKGLSNLPEALPPGSILILDDSSPMDGHDPARIAQELRDLIRMHDCEALLLDFQRPGFPAQAKLAQQLTEAFPCPVGVSELYSGGLSCPVFLPPAPPDMLLPEYLAPWRGRDIWLEAALDGLSLTLTEAGCAAEMLWNYPEDGRLDEKLHCHYTIETTADSAIFRLWRTGPDLASLLSEAESLGVTRAIGFWQELGR